MLFNRDLNLLCRIEEMCRAQIAEKEDRQFRKWQEKVVKKNCLASKRKVAHLREVLAGKGVEG